MALLLLLDLDSIRILDNLVSLCMKIINSVVVIGLYYGFLTTFSIGPSYLFLLRARVIEEGEKESDVETTSKTKDEFKFHFNKTRCKVCSVFSSPNYLDGYTDENEQECRPKMYAPFLRGSCRRTTICYCNKNKNENGDKDRKKDEYEKIKINNVNSPLVEKNFNSPPKKEFRIKNLHDPGLKAQEEKEKNPEEEEENPIEKKDQKEEKEKEREKENLIEEKDKHKEVVLDVLFRVIVIVGVILLIFLIKTKMY